MNRTFPSLARRLASLAFCTLLACASLAASSIAWAIEPAAAPASSEVKPADPLPSWNDGPTKKAILSFVAGATDKNGPDYIPPEDRIATFDNDGTLWCEKPTVEVVFTLNRLKALAAKNPALKEKQPFKAALEGDMEYLHKAGMPAILELVVTTHGDLSLEEFQQEAAAFFKEAKHPKFHQLFTKMTYQPMQEVLQYLRANGFQTWICSGGWMDLMRVMTVETYGIPTQQVIGSAQKRKFIEREGKHLLWLLPEILSICDKDGKPVNINQHIGKRPVFAAGNVKSGGDIMMLTYCQGSKYKTLQLMVNHDDAEREYAYAEPEGESLKASEANRWHVVSMKKDWLKIFAFEK